MVSIIVCTFRRNNLLEMCIQKIADAQPASHGVMEVVIVDNACDVETEALIQKKCKIFPVDLVYHAEPKTGLSNARNKGAAEARGEWLFFLDDDGFIHSDALREMNLMISQGKFDLFGGIYKGIFLTTPPKWLSPDFGTKSVKAHGPGPLGEDRIEGGIMVMKKRVWADLGGFNTQLGMNAVQQGFGEETEFVTRAIDKGYIPGIHPGFIMDHVVGEHKYSVWNQLNAYAALGRDMARTGRKSALAFYPTILKTPLRFIKYATRLLMKKNYYIENLIWDVLSPVFFVNGFRKGVNRKINVSQLSS